MFRSPTLRGPGGEASDGRPQSVLGLTNQTSPDTLAMVFVRTYHTRSEQGEAIRRRDNRSRSLEKLVPYAQVYSSRDAPL